MKTVLIHLRPMDAATGARVDVRVGDAPASDGYGLGGENWEPAILRRPQLSIELMSPEMDGAVQAGEGRFDLMLSQVRAVADPHLLYWRGAPVKIWTAPDLSFANALVEMDGIVTGARVDPDSRILNISCAVSTALIDKPLLTAEFTGGGGLAGDAAKRGTLKPAGFGSVKGIEPVWFDETDHIGMIDGYANCTAIGRLLEGASDFGPSLGNYASYAALKAAIVAGSVPPGQWATCVAEGLVGLGAPPAGVILVDATFGTNRPGAMMRRWIETHAGVSTGLVDTAAFAALDAAVDRPVHYWTREQRNVKDLLQAMAASCNATPLVSFQGKVAVTRATASAAVGSIDRSGSIEPRVLNWKNVESDPPWWQLKARTARPARVLSYDEVLYTDTIEDRGLFDVEETYRRGNVVWLSNGSQWLYINAYPTSGHVPPAPPETSDTWWQNMQPATTASDIVFVDGQTIEELKAQVIEDIDLNAAAIIEEAASSYARDQINNALSYLDGVPVKVVLVEERTQRIAADEAFAEKFDLLGAKSGDGTAFVLNSAQVRVGPDEASSITLDLTLSRISTTESGLAAAGSAIDGLGDALDAIDGRVTVAEAKVTTMTQTRVDGLGNAFAKFMLEVAANGVIAGMAATSDGETAVIIFSADEFKILRPGADPESTDPEDFLFEVDGLTIKMHNVEVDTLKIGSVLTSSIGANQVTRKTYWSQSWGSGAGAAGDTLGATAYDTWADFNDPLGHATVEATDVLADSDVAVRIYINAVRTGGDNDRVWFRLRRYNSTHGSSYVGDTIKVGLTSAPSIITYEWTDHIPTDGTYYYYLEYYRDDGVGHYYNAKMICDEGKR